MATAVPAPERVLPTLNPDGSRNRIRPKTFKGKYYRGRFVVGWLLLATFILIPFVKLNGKPLVLLDIGGREFTILGYTFLSTDGVVLMLAALAFFVFIFLLSALMGRVWCGWGCPQTVYMEFVFRPIEQLLEGARAKQMRLDREGADWRRVLKTGIFAILSVFLANVFVAYFSGIDRLLGFMTGSPFRHPIAFFAMLVTAVLVFLDFAYFREQMCTVACPYARLQSVLLDRDSLIVGYDADRGEPRARKVKADSGDCIDCNNCVVTCPTGIDIRQGVQLDCIACAQCADACDWVMRKLQRPTGLIRYGSQNSLEDRKPTRFVRFRVVAYSVLFLIATGALIGARMTQGTADVTILRGLGAPYVVDGGSVRNLIRIKIENRDHQPREYFIELKGAEQAELIAPVNPLAVEPGTHQTTTVFVIAPRAFFIGEGSQPVGVRVTDGAEFDRTYPYKLLGPRWQSTAPNAPATSASVGAGP
jgi:cytochrome c oxidase accessory protein FixG